MTFRCVAIMNGEEIATALANSADHIPSVINQVTNLVHTMARNPQTGQLIDISEIVVTVKPVKD